MTFEHGHENKSCSACRDRVNERVKVAKIVKVARVKVFQVFQNIPGFQLLSDIQNFFLLFQNSLRLFCIIVWFMFVVVAILWNSLGSDFFLPSDWSSLPG